MYLNIDVLLLLEAAILILTSTLTTYIYKYVLFNYYYVETREPNFKISHINNINCYPHNVLSMVQL